MGEQILVFPEKDLENFKNLNKFYFGDISGSLYWYRLNCKWMDRDLAENDPGFKQIINYTLLQYKTRFLVYQRMKGGGENRLHGKLSLGIGGHTNPCGYGLGEIFGLSQTVQHNLIKELKEELNYYLYEETNVLPLGFIYDDSSAVNAVHFGIVSLLSVDRYVTTSEKDKIEFIGYKSQSWLNNNYENFEKWSQICIDNLNLEE